MDHNHKIPMSSPELTEEDIKAVTEVLRTRYLSQGGKLQAFQEAVAAYTGSKYAVGVSSGTAALHLSLIAAGVGEGDLVITTPFSFIATSNSILFQKAVPVFVDIDPHTLNIDPSAVAQAADDLMGGGKSAKKWLPPSLRGSQGHLGKLKAVIAVDIFGLPADYDRLREVTDRHQLPLVEDACEAVGAEYKGRPAGTLGDVGMFAFYPNKQMTTGEGGMLITDRKAWADQFRSLRNQGRDDAGESDDFVRLGYNYRLGEMSAALGLSQIKRIDKLLARRERVAGWYNKRLSDVSEISVPRVEPDTNKMSWFVYVIRANSKSIRDRLIRELGKVDIPTRRYFKPIHLQPFYVQRFGYQRGDFPQAESASDTCLALPFSSVMTEEQVHHVCQTIKKILRN